MTHPSIEGLREAVAEAIRFPVEENWKPDAVASVALGKVLLYLTEHGVGWFGEELVREVWVVTNGGDVDSVWTDEMVANDRMSGLLVDDTGELLAEPEDVDVEAFVLNLVAAQDGE